MAITEQSGVLKFKDADGNLYALYPVTKSENLQGELPITKGGTGATDAATALTNLGAAAADHSHAERFTVSVPVSWTENSAGGYMQTISVPGILSTDDPVADIMMGDNVDTNALYTAAWALITSIVTADGSITLYANGEAPTTAFTIQMKAVR